MPPLEKKILHHPDRQEIINKLLALEPVKEVERWLKEKYPDDKEKQITFPTLSLFRREYLNMDGEAIRLLRKEREKQKIGLVPQDFTPAQPPPPSDEIFTEKSMQDQESYALKIKETLLTFPAYREKLKEVTDTHLDAPRLVKELYTLLSARIEFYYNEMATSTVIGDRLKTDKMMAEYARLVLDILKDSKKITDDYNSTPDEGTVNLSVVHEQVGMIRDAVKGLLEEIDPALALEFMDRLKMRIDQMKYSVKKAPNIIDQVNQLNKRIRDMQDSMDSSNVVNGDNNEPSAT